MGWPGGSVTGPLKRTLRRDSVIAVYFSHLKPGADGERQGDVGGSQRGAGDCRAEGKAGECAWEMK